MCTSIVTNTLDGKHILSRTMDFSKPLDPNPVFIPRNYQWISDADRTAYQAQYGFVGAGRKLSNTFFVADGVNEHGLGCGLRKMCSTVAFRPELVDFLPELVPAPGRIGQ